MKYLISKVLPLFFFPFPLFLIFSFVVLLKLKRGIFRKLYFILYALIVTLSVPLTGQKLLSVIEGAVTNAKPSKNADIIIVLTGMAGFNNPENRIDFGGAVDRILLALELFKARPQSTLIISGGMGLLGTKPSNNNGLFAISEARQLRKWILNSPYLDAGLKKRAKDIIVEPNSRNTFENAKNTRELILRKWGKEKLSQEMILITSAYHMYRAELCFRKQGLKVLPLAVDSSSEGVTIFPESYAPSLGGLRTSMVAFKQLVGIAGYWVLGYI